MYLMFSTAAAPLAWVSLQNISYINANPDFLAQGDDRAIDDGFVASVLAIPPLFIAVCMGLFFIIAGPRALRVAAATILLGWSAVVASALLMHDPFPSPSVAAVYMDAAPRFALMLGPILCGVFRLISSHNWAPIAEWLGSGFSDEDGEDAA